MSERVGYAVGSAGRVGGALDFSISSTERTVSIRWRHERVGWNLRIAMLRSRRIGRYDSQLGQAEPQGLVPGPRDKKVRR